MNNVKVSEDAENIGQPVTFQRLTSYLQDIIKPVSMTDNTRELLDGNARNWAYTTQLILTDHYLEGIQDTLSKLETILTTEWHLAFEIATKWSRRKFQNRMRQETIDQTEAHIVAMTQQEEQPQPQNTEETHPIRASVTQRLLKTNRRVRRESQEGGTFSMEVFPPPQTSPGTHSPKRQRGPRTSNPCVIEQIPHTINLEPTLIQASTTPAKAAFDPPVVTRVQVHQPIEGDYTSPEEHLSLDYDIFSLHGEGSSSMENPPSNRGSDLEEPLEEEPLEEERVNTDPSDQGSDSEEPLEEERDNTDPDMVAPVENSENSGLSEDIPLRWPRRHSTVYQKKLCWELQPHDKYIMMGDSNLDRIQGFKKRDLQIESYPGANFQHIESILKKCKPTTTAKEVVISVGITHRGHKPKETSIKQLQKALRMAKITFPSATIWIPIINYSSNFSMAEQDNLRVLNTHIEANMNFIPPLPDQNFATVKDNVHWTTATATAMLEHWSKHLNL